MTSPDPAKDPIRLLVADDDRLVRAGIVGILATAPDFVVAAVADDGAQAVAAADRHLLDVVLLDIQMPVLDGIGALRRLRHTRPDLPVAMLTTFSDEDLVADAVAGGALGFFLKSDAPRHLITGVRALAEGGAAFSPRVGRWLARRESTAQRRRQRGTDLTERLTARQRELLSELGRGRSNAEIARRLHLSEGTVKQYLRTLFDVLGTDNRVQAAILAHEAGLAGSEQMP